MKLFFSFFAISASFVALPAAMGFSIATSGPAVMTRGNALMMVDPAMKTQVSANNEATLL
jgi:hypothetical protein